MQQLAHRADAAIAAPQPDLSAIKAKMKATWEDGDYADFARYMEAGAVEMLAVERRTGVGVFQNPPQAESSGMTIFPLSGLFHSYAAIAPWFVAATPQVIRTGERPSNQGFRLDEKKGSLVPRCSGLAYRSG